MSTPIYLSTLLPRQYPSDAETLFTALAAHDVPYALLDGTRDVWVRDFMPVRTGSGKLVSFRYEPCYLKNDPDLRTDFRKDLAPQLGLPVTYSNINLDGGNVLEPERVIFLPVFGIEQDAEAETFARQLFSKEIVPVNIREIARQGGCLNCISWEGPHA